MRRDTADSVFDLLFSVENVGSILLDALMVVVEMAAGVWKGGEEEREEREEGREEEEEEERDGREV